MSLAKAFHYAYREFVGDRTRQIPFWILVGFLPTFAIARMIVSSAPRVHVSVHGTHIHHFTYGVIVLAVTGFISLVWPDLLRRFVAFVYGIGLALAFDEFGMWLHLTSNYHLDQSEDVMVFILVGLVFTVYGIGAVRSALSYLRKHG